MDLVDRRQQVTLDTLLTLDHSIGTHWILDKLLPTNGHESMVHRNNFMRRMMLNSSEHLNLVLISFDKFVGYFCIAIFNYYLCFTRCIYGTEWRCFGNRVIACRTNELLNFTFYFLVIKILML